MQYLGNNGRSKLRKIIGWGIAAALLGPVLAFAARTNDLWVYPTGAAYIQPNFSGGLDLLINGSNHYINFNTITGSSGYGIRDNGGTMEFKNNGGAWAGIGTGSGGGGGGGAGGWTFIAGAIYNSTTTDQVLIGATATSSLAKLQVIGGIYANASSSIDFLSSKSSTTTNATTTTFAIIGAAANCNGTSALTTNSIGAVGCTGQPQGTVTSVSGTSQQISSTGGATPTLSFPNLVVFPSNASSTLFSTTYGSTTNAVIGNLTGANLSTCNGANQALTWASGLFGCVTISSSGGGGSGSVSTSTPDVSGQVATFSSTSATPATIAGSANFTWVSPLLFAKQASTTQFSTGIFSAGLTATDTINGVGDLLVVGSTTLQNFTANNGTTTNATSTNLNVSGQFKNGSATGLALETSGIFSAYSGTNPCSSNQAIVSLNASGVGSCTSTFALASRNLTVAGTANQITSSAAAQDLSADRTWTLSLPSLVIFPGQASTTQLSAGLAYFGLTATSTFNGVGDLFVVGSTTLQNFTGRNATTSQATTTSLAVTSVTSALHLANSTGGVIAYGGSANCTNQVINGISAVGAGNCVSVSDAMLSSTFVKTLTVTTGQGVSGSFTAGATPALSLTLGALTGVTSFNGLIVTANNGTITTGIWNGTTVAIANGGSGSTTAPVSQLLYGGASAYQSVATTSPTLGSGFTYSGTFGSLVGGVAGTLQGIEHPSFAYATTTWVGTTTITLQVGYGEVFNSVRCVTNAGTVGVDFYHAASHLDYIPTASTTKNTFAFSTNATITDADTVFVDLGTPASSPTKVTCTIKDTF